MAETITKMPSREAQIPTRWRLTRDVLFTVVQFPAADSILQSDLLAASMRIRPLEDLRMIRWSFHEKRRFEQLAGCVGDRLAEKPTLQALRRPIRPSFFLSRSRFVQIVS